MATTTQRNQVIKVIGFFPVPLECPEWDDVMHVKTASKFVLGNAAMLACVLIALTSLVSLPVPVLTTRVAASSIPIGFVYGNAVIEMALLRTVEMTIVSVLGLVSFGLLAAISASEFDVRFGPLARSIQPILIVALRGAKSLSALALYVWVLLATLFTGFCFWRGTAMGHALRVGDGASIGTVFPWHIRGTVSFCCRWGYEKVFPAGFTNQSNGHQKILPTKDGRLVVASWGRPAVGSRLFGTVHEAVSSPCGIIPQQG